jgi:hypothetical protein
VNATSIGLGANAPIAFRYEFDNATVDRNGSIKLGLYELTSLSITLDGQSTYLTNPGYPQGRISISDNGQLDGYSVQALDGGPSFSGPINGYTLRSGGFGLSSISLTSWDSDALITSLEVLNGQRYSSVFLRFNGAEVTRLGTNGFGDDFTPYKVSVISSVPEPTSLALCFAGILTGLLAQVGYKNSKRSM